mgnify:FL=1
MFVDVKGKVLHFNRHKMASFAAALKPPLRCTLASKKRETLIMPNPLRMGGKLVGDTWVNTSDCEDFIEAGCAKFQASDYQSAITFFEKALTAEGAGTKRDRTKPAELTMGEKQSAYYNLTACHAKMENWDLVFASLELTFQSGYANGRLYGLGRAARDYELLEQDLDFENLRKDERWNTILTKYRVKGSELAFQLDPSNSSVGKAVELMSKRKKNT